AARPQVAELNVTANGALGSLMTQAAGFEKQMFTGSRTCTWKSTPDAWARLATPQNRARTNKTRRRDFILYSSKFGRGGAEMVLSLTELAEIVTQGSPKQNSPEWY